MNDLRAHSQVKLGLGLEPSPEPSQCAPHSSQLTSRNEDKVGCDVQMVGFTPRK